MTAVLPRWDLESIFPSTESSTYRDEFHAVDKLLGELERDFDRLNIRYREQSSDRAEERTSFEEAADRWNEAGRRLHTISSYTMCAVTVDTKNEGLQAWRSKLLALEVRMSKLAKDYSAFIGSIDVDALLQASEKARAIEFAVRKEAEASRHLMTPAEEALASDLSLTGSTAWGELHSSLTSQIIVTLEVDGAVKELPMSAVRTLAYDERESVRKHAYHAELQAWSENDLVCAAAMNGIKGEVATLARRRNWASPFEEALFRANTDRQTIEAMMAAAFDAFPAFRRYLRAKSRLVQEGKSGTLAWYNLFAPVGEPGRRWTFEEGASLVIENFHSFSRRMGEFGERMVRERWVDAEPRPGKIDGAYCAGIRNEESRILMNFKPSFGSVSTLAHEFGHAYHNLCLKDRKMVERETPMTLAETASIFCETIIKRAGIRSAAESERLSILDASLQGSCQTVVDITSRFLFEREVFERREERALSSNEMCEIMLSAQEQTYGDGMAPELRHPYMWAVKPHYYDAASYYNFPYMYGLLFALGLYAIYERTPDTFRDEYDRLLADTGLASGADLAQRFEIDVRGQAFWASSLAVLERDIDEFERLALQAAPAK